MFIILYKQSPEGILLRAFNPQPALSLIDNMQAELERLRGLLEPRSPEFAPGDPRNKAADGKLTPRGVEICYRLFAEGATRYAVSRAMNISFGAASHRQTAWRKAGGAARTKLRLDP